MKKYLIFFPLVIFLGCASHPMDPDITMTPPKYVEEMPSKVEEQVQNPGSLFTNGDNLFSDTKAKKVNDVVTIIITEQIKQTSQASKKLSEANSDAGGVFDVSVGLTGNFKGKSKHYGKVGIGLDMPTMNSNRTFQGSGNQQRKEEFKTTVTARIVKILANGNYYIYGTKEIYLDGQKQFVKVSGVIRPEDISPDNTIDSKYIADAKIAYETEGDLKRFTDQNWFAKFWSAVAPW